MGVDHEAGPDVPDRASHDRDDSPAFDVWATRDHQGGPALPARTSHPSGDGLVSPVRASHDHEDDAAFPLDASYDHAGDGVPPAQPPHDQEGDAAFPALPGDQEGGPALPVRASDTTGAASGLPVRKPRDQAASGLPARAPRDQEDGSGLPVRAPRAAEAGPRLPTRAPRGREGAPSLPGRASRAAEAGPGLPARTPRDQDGGSALPVRGARAPGDGSALPVRTNRYRRTGRHASPHQLSLASDTPALVIAAPGAARPENEETVARIADLAGISCHGALIRVGYLRGSKDHLEEVLDELGSADGGPAAVVVPLLSFPNAEADDAIAGAVSAARAPLLTAAHLGPHPLLAEALHARLADVGLARAARVGRISIVTAADGVIVGAAGEEDAVEGAGIVAVLLASRLTMPVAAASLSDPASIKDAANRLRDAGVGRVALAPCMIGPELTTGTLDAIAALTNTECASPLGSHPAIAQLVAIRYGAALADPRVASMMAEARGEPLPTSPQPAAVPPSGAAT
jgi:hypothetical protein